ncbi:MAG TPA: energy-coupling factor transporter transmembrane component T [Geobacteraceae bacterium]|nr:energy-coupling factor transporter transmembrane component T [Geobacteraceae bacterium]
MRRRMTGSDYACQYRAVDSPVHRLPAGWKMLISTALSVWILVVREPTPLFLATASCLLYYFLARLTVRDFWRDTRYFLVQFCILISLFVYREGYPAGVWPGVRTSLQIVLFFIPGIVFLRTTQVSSMMKGLRKVVPYRILFLLFTSLRFVPFFAREMQEISMAQKLRGARLSPTEASRPVFWRDIFSCLVLPLLVRAMKTADEAALSAQARGMGSRSERTYYDVRELEAYLATHQKDGIATADPKNGEGICPARTSSGGETLTK